MCAWGWGWGGPIFNFSVFSELFLNIRGGETLARLVAEAFHLLEGLENKREGYFYVVLVRTVLPVQKTWVLGRTVIIRRNSPTGGRAFLEF